MSVPSSYNAAELAAYMHGRLRTVAAACGYMVGSSYADAIVSTLVAYGVSDISQATSVPRLLALAEVAAWEMASTDTVPRTDVTTDGRSIRRSQFHDHAVEMLSAARARAAGYPDDGSGSGGSANTAGRVVVRYRDGRN